MRLIIAGGRNYCFTYNDYVLLDWINRRYDIECVITGGATGADADGKEWATARCLSHREILADWKNHGKKAGPIRNEQMVVSAGPGGLLVAFPGGRGTASVTRLAREYGLWVMEVPPEKPKPKVNPAARWRRANA